MFLPRWSRGRAGASLIVGGLIAAGFLLHVACLRAVTEDAFIAFRYARNLAAGHGFVWNPGTPPVEGYTDFLWVLLCALAAKLRLDLPWTAQALGTLAGLATLAYTYRFGRTLLHLPRRFAALPCLFLAVCGPFATWAGSGMETTLFGLLLLAAFYHHLRGLQGKSRIGLALAYVLLLLATLTRPEGLMLFLLLAFWQWKHPPEPGASGGGRKAFWWLIYLLPFGAYTAWRIGHFGYLLPNTFYAKVSFAPRAILRGCLYTAYFALHYLIPVAPLFLLGLWEKASPPSPGLFRALRACWERKENLPLSAGTTLVAAYTLYIVAVGGDYMAMYRFFVPLLPLVYLPLGPIVRGLFEASREGAFRRGMAGACILFAVAATLVHSTPVDPILFAKPKAQHGLYEGVQYEREAVAQLSAAGRYFKRCQRGENESVASMVIGAIGYYSEMNVLDMLGLTDTHIAHQIPNRIHGGLGFPGHEKSDLVYTLRQRPTYIFLEVSDRVVPFPRWGAEADQLLTREYELRSVSLEDLPGGPDSRLVYLERKDR